MTADNRNNLSGAAGRGWPTTASPTSSSMQSWANTKTTTSIPRSCDYVSLPQASSRLRVLGWCRMGDWRRGKVRCPLGPLLPDPEPTVVPCRLVGCFFAAKNSGVERNLLRIRSVAVGCGLVWIWRGGRRAFVAEPGDLFGLPEVVEV